MEFDQHLIRQACQLKSLGIDWKPSVGHYVYDETGAVQASSPFEEGVYFLLNFECFMRRVGGPERFARLMVWLPTWHDARCVLRSYGVDDQVVQRELVSRGSLTSGTELLLLYEMIARQLRNVEAGSSPSTASKRFL